MVLNGCSGPSVETYRNNTPRMDVREYFNGKHVGYGHLKDFFGRVTRRFTFSMEGKFDEKGGTLNESFVFDDGEKQSRTWKITMVDEHTFKGTASDGVGEATGKQYGNVINMQYALNVKASGSVYKVNFNDWLFLQPDGVVLNETTLSKFGLKLGTLTIVILKDQKSS